MLNNDTVKGADLGLRACPNVNPLGVKFLRKLPMQLCAYPVISVSATDYLSGTTYNGSGVSSIVIKNDAGTVVASGTSSASYTLKASDEGVHTWTVVATDGVGWQSSGTVSIKFDITAPGIDGTETTLVHNGEIYSGYCEDNIIDQTIDDKKWHII